MIAPVHTNVPFVLCEHSNCSRQRVAGMPNDAKHLPEKLDRVRISDQAHEKLNTRKKNIALIKDESSLGEEDKREVEKLKKKRPRDQSP